MSVPPAQYAVVTGSGTLSNNAYSGCSGAVQLCGGSGFQPVIGVGFCVGTTVNSTSSGATLNVASTSGFSSGQTLSINYTGGTAEYATILSVGSGTLTLLNSLTNSHSSDELVVTEPCVITTSAPAVAWFALNQNDSYYNFVPAGSYSGTITVSSSSGWTSGGGEVSISLTVIANNQSVSTIAAPGTIAGCANSSSRYWDQDTCNISPIANPFLSAAFTPPKQGNTYVDANFGTTIRDVQDSGSVPGQYITMASDAQVSAVNADGSLVMTAYTNGEFFATQSETGVQAYAGVPNFAMWDPVSATTLYYTPQGGSTALHKVTLNNGTNNTSGTPWNCSSGGNCTDAVILNYPTPIGGLCSTRDTALDKQGWTVADCSVRLTISSITPGNPTVATISGTIPASVQTGSVYYISGGSSCPALQNINVSVASVSSPHITFNVDTSSGCGSYDGSAAFNADDKLCAANVNTLATICGYVPYGPIGVNFAATFNAVNITNLNTPDNNFYIIETLNGGGGYIYSFSPGDSSIAWRSWLPMIIPAAMNNGHPGFTGPACGYPDAMGGLCLTGPGSHMTLVEVSGVQFYSTVADWANGGDVVFYRIDTLSQMTIDHEIGGGAYHGPPLYNGSGCEDHHMSGAVSAPVVLLAFDTPQACGGVNWTIQSVQINNVTIAAGVPTFTTTQTTASIGITNGVSVQITDVVGISNVNNTGGSSPLCRASSVTTNGFSCSNITTANGTYSGGTGVASVAQNPTPYPYTRSLEVDALFLDNLLTTGAVTMERLAITRSLNLMAGHTNGYYAQAHPGVSGTGILGCYESNFGLPDVGKVLCLSTSRQQRRRGGVASNITPSLVVK